MSDIFKHQEEIKRNIHKSFKNNDLEKGGEGSRGGRVIGHTKSGKPIYDSAKHPDHSNYTKQDHQDAIDTHKTLHQGHEKTIRDARRDKARTGSKEWPKEFVDSFNAQEYHTHEIRRHAQAKFSAPNDPENEVKAQKLKDIKAINELKEKRKKMSKNHSKRPEIQKQIDELTAKYNEKYSESI